ncbi:MAG: succinate dehydrogenase, partial [Bacteroidia bacterium]|nr:succinate dehydrogenase [Bacteroidia bacterium]
MKWFLDLLSSTLGRKVLVALTGIFLILFLVAHLAGNLQLLKDDGGRAFNIYAEFMGTNPIIQTISRVNFALILVHIIWTILLSRRNRAARGKVGYAIVNKSAIWSSRNMGILGTIILVFLVIHLRHFYAVSHFGPITFQTYDGREFKDLYTVVADWFSKDWYVGLYVA